MKPKKTSSTLKDGKKFNILAAHEEDKKTTQTFLPKELVYHVFLFIPHMKFEAELLFINAYKQKRTYYLEASFYHKIIEVFSVKEPEFFRFT